MVPASYLPADVERFVAERPKTASLAPAAQLPPRSPFGRDRARVLHSASFRRLAGKTQVVPPDEGDVPRTRLTHSLEVAQIARDIGAQLGADADLVDLAGLAHDIGHPPFGHNGETALDAVGAAAGGYEANAQNLRLLSRLEPKVLRPDGSPAGLNLTRAALDATLKYPWTRPAGGGKFGVYPDELGIFAWVRAGAPAPGAVCLEAQVMDWADDVAYSVHDVEDGVLGGRIDPWVLLDPAAHPEIVAAADPEAGSGLGDVLRDLLAVPVVADGLAGYRTGRAGAAAIKAVTSELTGRFVSGVVAGTRAAVGDGPLHRYDADLTVPPQLRAEVALLKAIATRYVMTDPARVAVQRQQQEVLVELVAVLLDRDDLADPDEFLDPPESSGPGSAAAIRLRSVLDRVSLLTDAQAVSWHRRFCG